MKLKPIFKYKWSKRAKILKKNDKKFALLNVKTNYKPTINMAIWHWYKNRELEKLYRIMSSDPNSRICGPLNVLLQNEREITVFSIKIAGKLPTGEKTVTILLLIFRKN